MIQNPSGKARDTRRSAVVFVATLIFVAGAALVLARAILHGFAAFPDLRLPGWGPVASASAASAAEDATPEIHGRILDVDGNPVPGAGVWLVSVARTGRPTVVLRDATTDAAGAFSFRQLSPMAARVAAEHDPEGAVTSAELAVAEGRSQELTLVLAPSAVRGDVVDSDGHPVAGASISITGAAWFSRTATTDDAGAFRIGAVAEEATTLVAAARGYATARVDVARPDGQAEVVVHVRLVSSPPVLGDVRDLDGPLAHARVYACLGQPGESRTETADDGTFELPSSALGCDAVAEREDHSPSDAVPVTAGHRLALRLKAGGAIEGLVLDDRGRAVPSFAVSVEASSSALSGRPARRPPQSYEDPRGAFRFERLQPGRYVLMATAPGRTPARSESIDVRGGVATTGVLITLAAGGAVVGHVYDDRRAPLAGVDLSFDAFSSTLENAATAKTDETGAYRLDGAPPGPFTLRAHKDGYRALLVSGLRVDPRGTIAEDVVLHALDGGPGLELGGIGANINQTSDGVAVNAVFAGDPAERAGLRPGDRIVRVDGEEADGLSLVDVLQRLRGPAGTTVGVTVQRAGEAVDLVIPRSVIVR